MKKFEIKAILRSFFIFFLSLGTLMSALFYLEYTKEVKNLDEKIFSQMRLCSYNLECPQFEINFADAKNVELYRLYKNRKGLQSYFSIPNSKENALSISLPQKTYKQNIQKIHKELFLSSILVLLVIVVLSILFSLYSLSPLRRALTLTEEFIKDILHDFNTPLATLRLNTSMLQCDDKESKKIKRIEGAVENILHLQSNLKAYLHSHETQKEEFFLRDTVQKSLELLKSNYPNISFHSDIPKTKLSTNPDALSRIVDNILSNAAKYNKQNGSVTIYLEGSRLLISDTGKGIQNPKKIFERFYKEQDRGIGIGLHIVKKLCEELQIEITVSSEINKGSEFTLELKNIML